MFHSTTVFDRAVALLCAALFLSLALATGGCSPPVSLADGATTDAPILDAAMDVSPMDTVVSDEPLIDANVCLLGDASGMRCGTTCIATDTDPMNCGECAHVCPTRANAMPACVGGGCAVTCATGFGDCDGDPTNGCEADLTEVGHCSSCTTVCTGATNAAAACTATGCGLRCTPGYADCDMDPANGCEVNLSLPTSCGTCTTVCPAASPNCTTAGATYSCASSCTGGSTQCGTSCVSTQTDPNHCGACNNRCPAVANGIPTCMAGVCRFVCNAGFGDCDGMAANGCEANFATTATACGSCSTRCPTPPNTIPTCSGGRCGATCAMGFANCDGSLANGCECTGPRNAYALCSGTSCSGFSCYPGFANCNGSGLDGCECAGPPHANPTCSSFGRICGTGFTCHTGYTNCNGLASDGCEVHTSSDRSNCGACGRVCGGLSPVCCSGACYSRFCPPILM